MTDTILNILNAFKKEGISTFKLGETLEFSNGLLGKAAKGQTKLSDEKFTKLKEYYEQYKFSNNSNSIEPKLENIEYEGLDHADILFLSKYCFENECTVLDLINTHVEANKDP